MLFFFISLHGLVRGENMELGRDSDTGGQVNLHGLDFSIKSTLFIEINHMLSMDHR